jgi:hypothetical protein
MQLIESILNFGTTKARVNLMVENHVEMVANSLDLLRSERFRVSKLKESLEPVAKVA